MKEEKGTKLSSYKLPVHKPERNFPQPEKKQYFSLAELREGDYAGMTESDSKTSGQDDGAYTKINQKSGKGVEAKGQNVGLHVKLDKNTRIG